MAMSVKEHIEAGHYPKDDKGRALVPVEGGGHIVVCGTDKPGNCPIIGWLVRPDGGAAPAGEWPAEGYGRLLSPPPRKVKVTARLRRDANNKWSIVAIENNACRYLDAPLNIVTTGEYEE